MELGRNDGDGGGVGEATFTNGSTFQLKAGGAGIHSEVFLQIGRGAGASGTMTFDNSTGTLDAAPASFATFNVGSDGASGLVLLDHTSHFTVNGGADGAGGNVGRGVGSFGKVTIANNSDLTLQGGNNDNGLTIGRQGGTGMAELTAGGWLPVTAGQHFAYPPSAGMTARRSQRECRHSRSTWLQIFEPTRQSAPMAASGG